jgi:polyketide biosynthesis enoyl-CoA hydratase PksH
MDVLAAQARQYETIRVRSEGELCAIQLHRPQDGNAISNRMVEEISGVLATCRATASIVLLEASPELFCLGADFKAIAREQTSDRGQGGQNADALYELWSQLASGPFISIAHVRGKVNAGGVGFVAACDLVLSDTTAVFSLSELLFGLLPACVLPFLIRRVGYSTANYLTLTTQPISARQALEWRLVDACEDNSENLLRKHLLRLRRLSKAAIVRHKRYMSSLDALIEPSRQQAVLANREVFRDPTNLDNISRYVRTGRFPWESPT